MIEIQPFNEPINPLEVVRPVQYLGSKLRTLSEISNAVESLSRRPNGILDLFSGSTVVSQLFRNKGFRVHSNDALKFCSTLAGAIIGDCDRKNTLKELIEVSLNGIENNDLYNMFKKHVLLEKNAISNNDPNSLIDFYHNLPQVWREGSLNVDGLTENLKIIKKRAGKSGHDSMGLFSFYYCGTYFGIEQSVYIDLIRKRINLLYESEIVTTWERDLMISALISAMSTCVFSAGKHFAQPHLIREGKDLSFVKKRILKDRSYDIRKLYEESLELFWRSTVPYTENGSISTNKLVSELLDSDLNVDLIYADPPYTAQQYSRFYHIPEVLVDYNLPQLQVVKGDVTRGLYPDDKYKSPFCSKSQALSAFNDIFSLAKKNSSDLILSYSLSKKKETGNERMISFESLMELCIDYVGSKNVSVVELDHIYRQFNTSSKVNLGKEDKEIQIICEVR